MEYEKHIKKLVLGYLKSECTTSYKIFHKIHFPHERKHVSTRVAGQTLEDILRLLSKIQDIVQGHLEDTDYYKEHSAELWSPTHLEEQLLYLLERKQSTTPTTSIPDRSSRSTSVSTNHELEDLNPISNVEATPEHALPGNFSCDELYHSMATERKSVKNPYFDETDVSMKLMFDKSFSHNLARTINTQLTPPETTGNHGKDKNCLNVNEETIKNVIDRTESDPAINQLLDDIVADTLEKVMLTGAENSLFSNTKQNLKNRTYVDDQINGAVSSILAISQEASTSAEHDTSVTKTSEATPLTQTSTNQDNQTVVTEQRSGAKPMASEVQPQKTCVLSVDTQQLMSQTPSKVYTLPPRALTTPGCQQQYLILNQPMNAPQSSQMVHLLPSPVLIDSGRRVLPKVNAGLTEDDIMSMPTLILNERNEVTYADINGIQLNTPFKLNEVHNLQEYFKAFGSSEQSPVIKKTTTQKKPCPIKPTPTIKVEIYRHDAPPPKPDNDPPTEAATPNKGLPSLDDTVDSEAPVAKKPEDALILLRDTPDEIKVVSDDKGLLKSSRSTHTPSPLVTTARKPTPKSSSHVRNLTFPSPVRKTPKSDNGRSPSKFNKQKATKDLFNEGSKKSKSPKKSSSPPKSKQKAVQPAAKKVAKKPPVAKKEVKIVTSSDAECASSWDTALRKNLPRQEEHKTPARRTSARKRTRKSSELDTSDPDGKKLEDALRTPAKAKTPAKPKTPNPKKAKAEKAKADKKITEEAKPEVAAKSENKTVLSPSKLCNTASKRNMEFDGVTPHNPKNVTQQPTMNARKNINSLLETPLKDDVPLQEIKEPDPTNSPFTPMLKANLQDLVTEDNFTIATPNFPVTPGLALMENSATNAYYIVDESEHNRATDEIVRLEERKSSTRKTDDDDVEAVRSPKVYSRPEMLEAFNRSRVGKKDLDLIEKVSDLSDIEEGSEKSSSLSDGESNKTVIRRRPNSQMKEVKRSQRLSGKSMTILKAYLLESGDNSLRLNESTNQETTSNTSLIKTGSSSDSEVVCREIHKKRITSDKQKPSNNSEASKRTNSADFPTSKDTKPIGKENNKKTVKEAELTISSITAEKIKETVSSAVSARQAGPPLVTSVKAEIEEKRKRMIEMCKTPSRKKNAKRQTPQTSKRKRRVSKNDEEFEGSEKIVSQDEFFIKSGSNLHRKQLVIDMEHGKMSGVDDKNYKDMREGEEESTATKGAGKVKISTNVEEDSEQAKEEVCCLEKPFEGISASIPDNPPSPTSSIEDSSYWDTSCTTEEQHHVIDITYNESSSPSTKRFEDYDLDRLKKGFATLIPCHDETECVVTIHVTPHRTLWKIPGEVCGSSRRNSSVEARDSDNENASPRLEESGELGCAKKRKHRSDSSSSTSSAKRMKATIPYFLVNDINIKTLLTKIHGPTDKA